MTNVPPVRVLIADDHQLFAESLGLTLDARRPRASSSAPAGNGKEAVRLAQELRPDVVLMDLEMPVLDGIEATREIGRLSECQVVVLTASLAVEDAHRARSAGAAAYLTKGCSTRDVIDALLEVVPQATERKEERRENAVAPLAIGALSTH